METEQSGMTWPNGTPNRRTAAKQLQTCQAKLRFVFIYKYYYASFPYFQKTLIQFLWA
jgi:hypothetical protein